VPILFRETGVLLGAGFVDPGFRGQLTLCLTNLGSDDIILKKNDRVVQMILHEVREAARVIQVVIRIAGEQWRQSDDDPY